MAQEFTENPQEIEQIESEQGGPGPKSKAAELYANLIKDGYTKENLGSEQDFVAAIKDSSKADKIYSGLIADGYTEENLGSKNDFLGTFVEKKSQVATTPSPSLGGPSVFSSPIIRTEKERVLYGPLSESKPKPKPKAEKPVKIDWGTYQPVPLEEGQKQRMLENEVRVSKEHAGSRAKYMWNEALGGIGRISAGAADLIFQGVANILPEAVVGASPEEAMKLYRQEVTPKIREGLKELAGADVSKSKEAQYQKEFFTSAVGGLASMAPTLISGMVAPGTVTTQFVLSGYDSGLEMINSTKEGQSLPESTKSMFGASIGMANGLLMKMNFDKLLGGPTEKVAMDLAIKTIKDLGAKEVSGVGRKITADAFEEALKANAQNLKERAVRAGTRLTETAAHGFLFGTGIETATQGIQEATNEITKKQIFEPTSWGERFSKILESGVHMATGNIILGTTMLPFNKVNNYISEKVAKAKSPEEVQAIKDEIIGSAQKKEIRQDDVDGLSAIVDKYAEIYKKIPQTVPIQNRVEAAESIAKRDEVEGLIKQKEEEINNLDMAFRSDAELELENLKQRQEELNAEILRKAKGEGEPAEKRSEMLEPGDIVSDKDGNLIRIRLVSPEGSIEGEKFSFDENGNKVVIEKSVTLPKEEVDVERKTTTPVKQKPSEEQQFKDVKEGNVVTFEYENESQVPDVFKDKISSKGSKSIGGKTYDFVRVTVPKSLADYELSRATEPIGEPVSEVITDKKQGAEEKVPTSVEPVSEPTAERATPVLTEIERIEKRILPNQQKMLDGAMEIAKSGETFNDAVDNLMKKSQDARERANERLKQEAKKEGVRPVDIQERLDEYEETKEADKYDSLIKRINDVYTEGKQENFKNSTQEAIDFEKQELDKVSKRLEKSKLEAKKADIERRRQEEFDQYENDIIVKTELYEDGEGRKYLVHTLKNGKKRLDTANEEGKRTSTADVYESSIPVENYIMGAKKISDIEVKPSKQENRINAKYDAELAALETKVPVLESVEDYKKEIKRLESEDEVGNAERIKELTKELGAKVIKEAKQAKEEKVKEEGKAEVSIEPVRLAVNKYVDGEIKTFGDLVNEIEGIAAEEGNMSLQKAVDKYREEERYNAELKGRGDMDAAEESFMSEVMSAKKLVEGKPIKEVYKNRDEVPVGTRVYLEGFGDGTVLEMSDFVKGGTGKDALIVKWDKPLERTGETSSLVGMDEMVLRGEKPKVEAISQEEIVRQMLPITDKMVEIEREFENNGYEIKWDYDNETVITDKKGEFVDAEDLPKNLLKLAGDYEKATSKLGDYDNSSLQAALKKSREVTEVEAEIVKPKELPKAEEKNTSNDYANYLLDLIQEKQEKLGWEDAPKLRKGLVEKFEQTLNERGENRAISDLESTYIQYVPESVRANAYQLLKENFKKQTKKEATKEEKKLAEPKKEGEKIEINTPEGKEEGEVITIPGFEDIGMVATKDGMSYKVRELVSGMEIASITAFDIADAKAQVRDVLISSKITAEKIYNAILNGKVKAINESAEFELYKAAKDAIKSQKPFKLPEKERKELLDIADDARAKGLDVVAKMIETIANVKEDSKWEVSFDKERERAINMVKKAEKDNQLKRLKERNQPYPEADKKILDDSEAALKERVNSEYEKDKYSLIPINIRERAAIAYSKLVQIHNKYGYWPKSITEIDNLKTPIPEFGLAFYIKAANAKKVETRPERIKEALKLFEKGISKVNRIYEKEIPEGKRETVYASKVFNRIDAKKAYDYINNQMPEPSDARSLAMRYLAGGGKVSSDSFSKEITGYVKSMGVKKMSEEARKSEFTDTKSPSIDTVSEMLWEQSNQSVSDMDIKDQLIDLLGSYEKRIDIAKDYIADYDGEAAAKRFYEQDAVENKAEFDQEMQDMQDWYEGKAAEDFEVLQDKEFLNQLIKEYETEYPELFERGAEEVTKGEEGRSIEEVSRREDVGEEKEKIKSTVEELKKVDDSELTKKIREQSVYASNNIDRFIESIPTGKKDRFMNNINQFEATNPFTGEKKIFKRKSDAVDYIINETSRTITTDGRRVLVSEAYHKAKKDGSNPELVKNVEDLIGKPKEIAEEGPKQKAKSIADKIRSLKIDMSKKGLQSNIAGVPIAVYNAAIETIAKVIEAGGSVTEAINKAIKKHKLQDISSFDEKTFIRDVEELAGEKYESKPTTRGIRMVDNKERRAELGMPDRQPNPESFEKWDNEAQELLEKGYDIEKLIQKMESGEATTPVENSIRKIYAATLDAELQRNPTIENQRKAKRFIQASDVASSQAGKQLVSLKSNAAPLSSFTDFMVAKMEANGVDELTPEQLKSVQDAYDKVVAERDKYESLYNESQKQIAKIEAQKELNRIKGEKKDKKVYTPEGKRDYKAERDAIKEQLKEKYKKYVESLNKLGIASNGGADSFAITFDMAKLIMKIVRSHTEEVGAKLSEVAQKTADDLKDIFDGITDKDVIDVIAGKYNPKRETLNQLQADMKDIQTEAKLLKELDRVMSATPKNERQKVQKNQRLAAIRAEIDKVKREKGLDQYSTEEKVKRLIEANKKKEQEIKEKIANKDFEPKQKPLSPYDDPDFKKNNPALYKQLLDSYTAKQDAQNQFEIELLKDAQSKMSRTEKVINFGEKAVNTTKKLVTGVDDSALFMQTLVAMVRRPIIGAKAFKAHIVDAVSKKSYERNLAELHNSPMFDLMQKSGLDITEPKSLTAKAKEEAFAGESLDFTVKIKGKEHKILGTLLEPFERAFTSLGNNMRAIAFIEIANKFMAEGNTFENNPKLFKDLATMLNTETGRGKQNEWVEKANKLVAAGIWSPRLMASRLNILGISDALSFMPGTKGYYRQLSPKVRMEAIKGLVQFATTMAALTYTMAYIFGGDVDDDPTSQGFMDIRIGNKSYNLLGGFAQYVRLLAQTRAGGKTVDGKFVEFKGNKDRGSNALHFLRGKLTPVAGTVTNIFTGKDYVGQPITVESEVKRLTIPLSMQDLAKNIERDGLSGLYKGNLPSFVGIGVKDKRDFNIKTDLYSVDEEKKSDVLKTLLEKGIETPAMGSKKSYKIMIDEEHPEGIMTDKEFEEVKKLVHDNLLDRIQEIFDAEYVVSTYDEAEDEEISEETMSGKDLPIEQLKEKIYSAKQKLVKEAMDELEIKRKYKVSATTEDIEEENNK